MIRNGFHTPGILFTLLRNVNRQKLFLKKFIAPELIAAQKSNDGSLDKEDFNKITGYYGLAVPAILGEALCVLRGTKMTLQERLALTCQGAITGLGDDFFDKQDMADGLIKTLIENPDGLTGNNSSERLFLSFYKRALQNAHNREMTLQYLRRVFEAQKESRKQGVPGLCTKNELEMITIQKGATSVLFYRTVLSNPLEKEEEEALFQMGGLMQLANDIFDVHKDCQKSIDTLVTTVKNILEVRVFFKSQMEKCFALFYNTRYPRKNVNHFLRLIAMSLCSRCFVCLDQLEEKEKETNNIFLPGQYERKDLVCDMQKTSNKLRTISYFIKHRF